MAPILASMEAPSGHTVLKIISLPSEGYELSFGSSLAKISRDGCIIFYV